MKRLLLLLLLLVVPVALVAAEEFRPPTPEELAMKDVPWARGAAAVVLDWNVRHNDDESWATESVRIKVLTEEGKKYGSVELFYVPMFHTVRELRARTIAPNGTITPFTGRIYEKPVVKGGGIRWMQKTFTLANVEPGSIIEYRYTNTWPLTQLRTDRWMLQREIPIARASFWIKPYRQNVSSICTTKGLPPDKKVVTFKDHFEFTIEKMAPFESEPLSPPETELKPRVEFFYTSGDATDYWLRFGKERGETIEAFIGDRAAIRKAAAEIIAGADSDEEKLRRLYTRVQQLRNRTFEKEKTEQETEKEKLRESDHIAEVLRVGYGYRSELNQLFIGLARAAGFEADAVLVSCRDEYFLSRSTPDARQLPGTIAVVKTGGAERFLDPGTPKNPYGLLSWDISAAPAIRLKPKTSGTWITTPDLPYTNAVTSRSADVRLADGALKGTATITYRGQEALIRRLESLNEDESENRKRLEKEAKALFPEGSVVRLTDVRNLDATDDPLIVSLDIELPNLAAVTGSRVLLPLSLFTTTAANPFVTERRKYPVYLRYQQQVHDRVTLHVPAGFAVENVPKNATADVGACGYSTSWKEATDEVTFERRLTLKTVIVTPEYYAPLRKFYGDVFTSDQATLVLKRS